MTGAQAAALFLGESWRARHRPIIDRGSWRLKRRRSSRCGQCGGKGAYTQLPGWGGLDALLAKGVSPTEVARKLGIGCSSVYW